MNLWNPNLARSPPFLSLAYVPAVHWYFFFLFPLYMNICAHIWLLCRNLPFLVKCYHCVQIQKMFLGYSKMKYLKFNEKNSFEKLLKAKIRGSCVKSIWGLSVSTLQLFCTSKIIPKSKDYFKKKALLYSHDRNLSKTNPSPYGNLCPSSPPFQLATVESI